MDLGTLLLVLLFLVLPLLQQLLSKGPGPPGPPRNPEDEAGGVPWEVEPHPDRLPPPRPRSEQEAAMEALEALAGREVVDEAEAAELTVRQKHLPAETVPEAVRVSAPVVSLEPLRVDRPLSSAGGPARLVPTLAAPTRPAGHRVEALLRGSGQLRRAVLLSEVLSPPKGLN